jgi:hypothetical protein
MKWVHMVSVVGWLLWVPYVATAQVPRPNVFDGGNHWQVTCYNDPSAAHLQQATQGICFLPYAVVGQSIQGYWYGTNFPDWNGRYSQEGDQVRMHGDYDENDGHDGLEWEVVSARTGSGHWTEWRETPNPGRTITFCNANWTRTGSCGQTVPPPTAPDHVRAILELSEKVPPRCLPNGDLAPDPLALRQQACR